MKITQFTMVDVKWPNKSVFAGSKILEFALGIISLFFCCCKNDSNVICLQQVASSSKIFGIYRIMTNVCKNKAMAKYVEKILTLERMDQFTFIIYSCSQNDKVFLTLPFTGQFHEKKRSVWSIYYYSPFWQETGNWCCTL